MTHCTVSLLTYDSTACQAKEICIPIPGLIMEVFNKSQDTSHDMHYQMIKIAKFCTHVILTKHYLYESEKVASAELHCKFHAWLMFTMNALAGKDKKLMQEIVIKLICTQQKSLIRESYKNAFIQSGNHARKAATVAIFKWWPGPLVDEWWVGLGRQLEAKTALLSLPKYHLLLGNFCPYRMVPTRPCPLL